VQDIGIGMTPEHLSRFLSVRATDASTTRRFGGTGLGLAISKPLVERWAAGSGRGEPGVVDVPLHVPRSARSVRARRAPIDGPAMRGLRMLVVDDNATNRASCARWVIPGAWWSRLRVSGVALEHLRHEPPFQLALLDYNMPEMDGPTLAREIRNRFGGAMTILIPRSGGGSAAKAAGSIVRAR
jgi:hypothetical protein